MSKLKTLKDFRGSLDFSVNVVSIISLRKEAINHIKSLELEAHNMITNHSNLPFQPNEEEWIGWHSILCKRDWIFNFFNITERDLK